MPGHREGREHKGGPPLALIECVEKEMTGGFHVRKCCQNRPRFPRVVRCPKTESGMVQGEWGWRGENREALTDGMGFQGVRGEEETLQVDGGGGSPAL